MIERFVNVYFKNKQQTTVANQTREQQKTDKKCESNFFLVKQLIYWPW